MTERRRVSLQPGDARGWRWAIFAAAALVAVLVLGGWLVGPYALALGRLGAAPGEAPSRLWARPTTIARGDALSAGGVAEELAAAGYRDLHDGAPPGGEPDGPPPPGWYRWDGDRFELGLRRRPTPAGAAPAQVLAVVVARGRAAALTLDGEPVPAAELEAPLLASYPGADARDVWPVEVGELPAHVVDAVLAAEDAAFRRHAGLSVAGIARAGLANLRSGRVEQGGSTITQQLVKNAFLSHERSLDRKLREAFLAFLVDALHPKDEILQAYLNRIYLGAGGGVSYHGLGAAARAYYGKHPADLTVGEAATLAGMIRSPANLSPRSHPEAARERRDVVLGRMAELGWLDAAELARALDEPVAALPARRPWGGAPHFADHAAEEARRRFGAGRLAGTGYHLFATVGRAEQEAARRAVRDGLEALDDGLEAALVSVAAADGAILAWVGGRDGTAGGFDRVTQARRQAGSAIKPVVLAAALAEGASPSTRLADEPLAVPAGGRTWRPRNADRRFRGPVTLRTAIEDSLNVPVVRLAMDVGLDDVAEHAERLGFADEPEALPAMALGAVEVTPWEMATVYATLAAGGERPTLHGLSAVLSPAGEPLDDRRPPERRRVLDPAHAYVATAVLQGVVERGTGQRARRYRRGPLAAKTGTSNRGRDAWFAAYDPERATVVWVGRDDAEPAGLSGARSALPIWGRFAAAVPAPRADAFPEPPGITRAAVCPTSGLVPNRWCPPAIEEVFAGPAPDAPCDLHAAPPPPRRVPRDQLESFLERLKRRIGW
jgi:penicillin-binding protein 1B